MSATAIRDEHISAATMNAVIIYDRFDLASKAPGRRTRPCTGPPIQPSASPSVWGHSLAIWPHAGARVTTTDRAVEPTSLESRT